MKKALRKAKQKLRGLKNKISEAIPSNAKKVAKEGLCLGICVAVALKMFDDPVLQSSLGVALGRWLAPKIENWIFRDKKGAK